MKRQIVYRTSFKSYLKVMIVFVAFILVCSFSFFFYVQNDIKEKSVDKVVTSTEKQTESFKSYINVQYRYLEGIGNYMSSQDLFCDNNLKLLKSVKEYTKLENIAIIDLNGESHYDNGATKNVAHRQYFQEAIKGNRVLSDPLSSSVSSKTRVILAVPIYDQQKQIVGVLGGSYDIGDLNKIIFKEVYDGQGTACIISKDGELISYEAINSKKFINSSNVYDYFKQYQVLSSKQLSRFKNNFTSQKGGYVVIEGNNKKSYMAYYPLKINDWMMCYSVDVNKAKEPYTFIIQAEYQLLAIVIVAVLVLLFTIFKLNNKHQKKLIHIAKMDALTGIKNKETLKSEISTYLMSNKEKTKGALFMIDVDNFKTVNDLNGHVVGDEVLKHFGTILKNSFDEHDIVGRAGGDEFIVFMKNIEDDSVVKLKAEELCNNIRSIKIPKFKGNISCSIGISLYPLHGYDFKTLYSLADQALYQTKDHGKNGYTCYQE